MEELERRKELDSTVFIVVGDHGEGFGRFGRPFDRSHGNTVTEDALRVPLIVSHPALGGRVVRIDTPVYHGDLYPTLIDLLSRTPSTGTDGVSLLGPIPSRPFIMRGDLFWPAAVRCGREKLVMLGPGDRPQLYDTEADPTEQKDLTPERPQRAADMQRYLLWHQVQGVSDPWYSYGTGTKQAWVGTDADPVWRSPDIHALTPEPASPRPARPNVVR